MIKLTVIQRPKTVHKRHKMGKLRQLYKVIRLLDKGKYLPYMLLKYAMTHLLLW